MPLAAAPAGKYSKMEGVLIVFWECSCPLLNKFYRKRHLMEYPPCKINLFPEFPNYPQGLGGRRWDEQMLSGPGALCEAPCCSRSVWASGPRPL